MGKSSSESGEYFNRVSFEGSVKDLEVAMKYLEKKGMKWESRFSIKDDHSMYPYMVTNYNGIFGTLGMWKDPREYNYKLPEELSVVVDKALQKR